MADWTYFMSNSYLYLIYDPLFPQQHTRVLRSSNLLLWSSVNQQAHFSWLKTWKSRLVNYGTQLATRLSKFSRIKNWVLSRLLLLASDYQLTFEQYCIPLNWNLLFKVIPICISNDESDPSTVLVKLVSRQSLEAWFLKTSRIKARFLRLLRNYRGLSRNFLRPN